MRAGDWTVAPVPADLRDRRVEITGPTDPKMAINALNSGARVWLADLEDANTPHWRNVVGGQLTLRDAVRGQLSFTSPEGKEYAVTDPARTPVVLPRPRGWHFDEAHLTADGRPVVAALVDFGLHFFHNARELLAERQRALLLPAQDGVPPRGAALGRRLHPRRGDARACRTGRSGRRC